MKVTTIKKTLSGFTLALILSISNPAVAVFGIGDVVFDPTQATNMIKDFAYWAQQLQQMKAQLEQAKNTYGAMTGNRGYGNYMNIPNQMRNYIPTNFSDVMTLLSSNNPSYSGMTDTIRKYMDANAVLTDADLDGMKMSAATRKYLTDSRSNTATIQALANEGLQNASVRFNLLQSLAYEINNTTDPKAIAELQARIQVEQTMLTNEQSKMQDLFDGMQARKEMIDQQGRELAIQQSGKVSDLQQPDLSNINYGYNN
jgi:type IV secretion system protein VirB5